MTLASSSVRNVTTTSSGPTVNSSASWITTKATGRMPRHDHRTHPIRSCRVTNARCCGGWLEYHRATLAMKCEGLTDDQLRLRSVEPSAMSLLGLVRHMGEVERDWFRRVMGQIAREDAPPRFYDDTNIDGDFDDVDTADVAEAFTYWREECQNARTVEASFASLDDCGWRPAARRHLVALGAGPHDRGVRPPQRPRRPPPRAHRRHDRRLIVDVRLVDDVTSIRRRPRRPDRRQGPR